MSKHGSDTKGKTEARVTIDVGLTRLTGIGNEGKGEFIKFNTSSTY